MKKYLFTSIALLACRALAAETLTEDLLYQEWKKSSPQLKGLAGEQLSSQFQWQQRQEVLQWSLEGEIARTRSQEQPFFQFAPALRNSESAQLAVQKMTSFGVGGKVGVARTTTTNTLLKHMTNNGLFAEVSIDLWKNLFGEQLRESLRESALQSQFADLSRQIQEKALWQSVRKLFWNLAATEESLLVSQEQLKLAKEQFSDTQSRAKNSISESGDVARAQAQVSAREAAIASLQYQKGKLLQRLQQWIPSLPNLSATKLDLEALNREGEKALACTSKIASFGAAVPKNHTYIDDMITTWQDSYTAGLKATEHYSRPNVQLFTSFEVFGQGVGQSVARKDFSDDPKTRQTIGLRLTIPLSSEQRDSEKTLKKLKEAQFHAQYDSYQSQLEAEHQQMISSISLMNTLLAKQTEASKQLAKGLGATKTKFQQARIGLRELIQDQDQYFQSEIGAIQAKLIIAEALLDYLAVFSETPCAFNPQHNNQK